MKSFSWMLVLSAGLASACHSVKPGPEVVHPLLFPAGGLYELLNPKGEATGYIFAETGPSQDRQTLRWLLFANFKSPTVEDVYFRRAAKGAGGLPTTAAELAKTARMMMESGARATWVKSYADTFTQEVTTSGANYDMTTMAAKVPVPAGRRPPDPPGQTKPVEWLEAQLAAGRGKSQQMDDGTVGIRPGDPPAPTPTPMPGPGYLDPRSQIPVGLIGVGFAGPQLESNVEYLFLSSLLFDNGLDRVAIGPFRNLAVPMDGPPLGSWAVVVVSSSYYPGYVPNQW